MASLHEILVREVNDMPDDWIADECRRLCGVDLIKNSLMELDDDTLKELNVRLAARLEYFFSKVLKDRNERNDYEDEKATKVSEKSQLGVSDTNDSNSGCEYVSNGSES